MRERGKEHQPPKQATVAQAARPVDIKRVRVDAQSPSGPASQPRSTQCRSSAPGPASHSRHASKDTIE